jgi:Mn-dependent DtxR family transcriptional regulator
METVEGLELTPRKVEYLKFLYGQGGTARTTEIASHFSVDPSTITKTICELSDAGYLLHTPYRGVVLTEEGKRYAGFLIKRHRILSLIFVRNGLSDEEACREVSRFESFISRDAIDTMCRAMGHPQQGTCGEITHDEGCMAAREHP